MILCNTTLCRATTTARCVLTWSTLPARIAVAPSAGPLLIWGSAPSLRSGTPATPPPPAPTSMTRAHPGESRPRARAPRHNKMTCPSVSCTSPEWKAARDRTSNWQRQGPGLVPPGWDGSASADDSPTWRTPGGQVISDERALANEAPGTDFCGGKRNVVPAVTDTLGTVEGYLPSSAEA